MLINSQRTVLSLIWLVGSGLWFPGLGAAQTRPKKPTETTITALVESSAKFNGTRVRVLASFRTDGIERSVLLEPYCGRPDNISATPPPGELQCSRGIAPINSDKADQDPGKAELDRVLAESGRSGTVDKHITAEFTGKFSCAPSCANAKRLNLEVERVENLKVEMKELKPHRPKDQPNGR